MPGYAAVVTDLDGTIVRSDGTISMATIKALEKLGADGVPVIAATARTPHGYAALAELAPHITLAVVCNGGVGLSPHTGRTLWTDHIAEPVVAAVLDYVARHMPGTGVALFDGDIWHATEEFQTHRGLLQAGWQVGSGLSGRVACSMSLCHPELSAEEAIAELRLGGFEQLGVAVNFAGAQLVYVAPSGVDKFTGVRKALETLGVAAERAVAFGDMPIDLPMFRAVGHSVAMGNAHPDVIAAATTVTLGVDEDGFAHFLR